MSLPAQAAIHLNYADPQVLAEGYSSGLDLFEFGGVAQVKQAINLRHMPAQPARKLCFFYTLFHHGLIDPKLCTFKG